ncbi:unnamed protein product [Prunus armeniaca]
MVATGHLGLELKMISTASNRLVASRYDRSITTFEERDNDSCVDEFDVRPPSALPLSQSTHDNSKDALSYPKWVDAMNVEMETLNKNATWELVPLLKGKKYKADGFIDRYKVRLVAKGYTQTYGMDYMETFAPVARLNTMHVVSRSSAEVEYCGMAQSGFGPQKPMDLYCDSKATTAIAHNPMQLDRTKHVEVD